MKIEGLDFIYKITSPSNRVYIGKTGDWAKRFKAYNKLNCKNQKLLYNSLVKYGWEAHNVELLCVCNREDTNKVEIRYIKEHNSYKGDNELGMNLTRGGSGKIPKGFHKSPEGKKKHATAMAKLRGSKRSEETCWLIGNAHRGKKLTQKQKDAVAEFFSIPILQYNLEGNFIKEWKSASEAARQLGITVQMIHGCANNHPKCHRAGNNLFRIKSNNYPLQISPFKVPETLEYAIIELTNLVNGEVSIFNGAAKFKEATSIPSRHLWRAFKAANGLFRDKKLRAKILGYGLIDKITKNSTRI